MHSTTAPSSNKTFAYQKRNTNAVKTHDNPACSLEKYRILVVEDQALNQVVVKNFLEKKGYTVDIAATGQAALSLYDLNPYALILMDIGLPDIQGTEVTQKIRALEKITGIHTPIIALTANGLGAKPACLAVGMDDFSVKPFNTDTLDTLIQTWLH